MNYAEETAESDPRARNERRLTAIILAGIMLLACLDIAVDLSQGVDIVHICVEAVIIPMSGFGVYLLWRGLKRLHEENRSLRTDLARVVVDAKQWRTEAQRHIEGLADAIDSQFTRWGLTPAEKEIALLLLKGLSHKEIAEARSTTERTVRQQALGIYSKSGIGGRAELSAFFLEDLLLPSPAD